MLKKFILLFLICISIVSCMQNNDHTIESINQELSNYPKASLADIYKNFFQDAYGPRHIIQDKEITVSYLNWELNNSHFTDSLLWQPLGKNHDFYRINLKLIIHGTIPEDTLLNALIRSSEMARKPDIASWRKEWKETLQIINKMNLNLPNVESDQNKIDSMLEKGEVVMHHSNQYVELYNPHYRIIHRSFFEEWLKRKYFEIK